MTRSDPMQSALAGMKVGGKTQRSSSSAVEQQPQLNVKRPTGVKLVIELELTTAVTTGRRRRRSQLRRRGAAPVSDAPRQLDLKKDRGLTVEWADGSTRLLPVASASDVALRRDARLRQQQASNPLTVLPSSSGGEHGPAADGRVRRTLSAIHALRCGSPTGTTPASTRGNTCGRSPRRREGAGPKGDDARPGASGYRDHDQPGPSPADQPAPHRRQPDGGPFLVTRCVRCGRSHAGRRRSGAAEVRTVAADLIRHLPMRVRPASRPIADRQTAGRNHRQRAVRSRRRRSPAADSPGAGVAVPGGAGRRDRGGWTWCGSTSPWMQKKIVPGQRVRDARARQTFMASASRSRTPRSCLRKTRTTLRPGGAAGRRRHAVGWIRLSIRRAKASSCRSNSRWALCSSELPARSTTTSRPSSADRRKSSNCARPTS